MTRNGLFDRKFRVRGRGAFRSRTYDEFVSTISDATLRVIVVFDFQSGERRRREPTEIFD